MICLLEKREINIDTDDKLVERVLKTGDRDAFESLVEKYKNPVLKILFRLTGDYDMSLDLAQETFLKCWKYLKSYNPDMKFSSWLFKIATNLAKDYRSKKNNDYEELQDETIAVSGWEQKLDGEIYVASILQKLKEPYKTAMTLRFIKDMDYCEIAKIMDTGIENIKNYLFRGRKYLLEIAGKEELL